MKIFSFACYWLIIIAAGVAQESNKPKNIIILMGDGMGPSYVSASVLSLDNDPFKKFNSIGFSVTCSADNLLTDSAAGATAISTGYRTKNGSIGVDASGKEQLTILELAEKLNLSTGVVATSSVTHATPASFVAHQESRSDQIEIAKDFVDLDIDVAIGGGSGFFLPENSGGKRIDGTNLVETLKVNGYAYIDDEDDLFELKSPGKLYALLEKESLPKACDRSYSLGQLTQVALNILSLNETGFVLLVEGSQIDWAGHNKNEDYLLSEQKDFNSAINTALNFADNNQSTLVLVTADHETGGMSITGGSKDGEDIELEFLTSHHTATMVGVFAKGPGEELFRGIQDNYQIGRKLIRLLDAQYSFELIP